MQIFIPNILATPEMSHLFVKLFCMYGFGNQLVLGDSMSDYRGGRVVTRQRQVTQPLVGQGAQCWAVAATFLGSLGSGPTGQAHGVMS